MTGNTRGGSVRQVLVEDGNQEDNLVENTTQELVQEAIYPNIHCKQFFLAEAVPICTGGLQGQFGYNATIRTAKAILAKTYESPPGFDQDMREICEECAQIWEMIPIDSLNTLITKDDWRHQWKGCHKSTSLLESGLHFGHYIAGLSPDHISYFHALKATLIIRRGVVLDRWAWGLSVMLEKMCGCALFTKLRSILLMEADFNATNKIVYGQQMLH